MSEPVCTTRRARVGSPVDRCEDEPMEPVDPASFQLPHTEKIEWMIETDGWAFEPVLPDASATPPVPAHGYTIGVGDLCGFPEIFVAGLTPVAARGLVGLVVDALRGGTDIPVDAELVGLLDNDLRCRFVPMSTDAVQQWCPTAVMWAHGATPTVVQLLYPDRNGFLPYEVGFDQRMRAAQPVIGEVAG